MTNLMTHNRDYVIHYPPQSDWSNKAYYLFTNKGKDGSRFGIEQGDNSDYRNNGEDTEIDFGIYHNGPALSIELRKHYDSRTVTSYGFARIEKEALPLFEKWIEEAKAYYEGEEK